MDIHEVSKPFRLHFRRKRLQVLYKNFNINNSVKLIDIGGDLFFWDLADKEGLTLPQITIVNIYDKPSTLPDYITWVVADGKKLPFNDFEFDIAFCNSVIEHLGNWESQLELAKEIKRVAPNYFVQTPNQKFPVEPHFITPFIHWLPKAVQKRLIRNFTIWGLVTRPTSEYCEHFLAELRLLEIDEMFKLFSDSSIVTENFLGIPKSIYAIK
jgi:hypothetical protein